MRRYSITVDDLTVAMRTNALCRSRSAIGKLAAVGVAVGLIVGWIVGALDGDPVNWLLAAGAGLAYAAVVAVVIIAMLWGFAMRRSARRQLAQCPALRSDLWVEWDDYGVRYQTIEGQGGTEYGHFHRFAEAHGQVLLYRTDNLFQLLPASVFQSDADRQTLIAGLVAAGVRPR